MRGSVTKPRDSAADAGAGEATSTEQIPTVTTAT